MINSLGTTNFQNFALTQFENILGEKESPSDDINKWLYLIKNHVYQIK